MSECNSIKSVNFSGLRHQAKFRLNKINKIKDYFNCEMQEQKILIKKLSKYIAAF